MAEKQVTLVSPAGVRVRVKEARVAALKVQGFKGLGGRPKAAPKPATKDE